MGEPNADTTTPGAAAAAKVSLDVSAVQDAAVTKAMDDVSALVAGIAKAAGVDNDDTPDGDGNDDVEKNAKGFLKALLSKGGLKGDALAKALESAEKDFDKRFGGGKKPAFLKDKDATKDTTKADDAPAEPTQEDTILATLDTIQKAKAFTPQRIDKIAAAVDTLQKLLMEVIAPNATPKTKVPGVGTHPNPNTTRAALVGKSGDDADPLSTTIAQLQAQVESVAKAIEGKPNADPMVEQLEAISKRLELIEKARPDTQSVDGEGGTDTSEVKKSFWAGVL